MKTGDEVVAVVTMFIIGGVLGFFLGRGTLDYEEDCHIYRDVPTKEARHCKLRYKDYKD